MAKRKPFKGKLRQQVRDEAIPNPPKVIFKDKHGKIVSPLKRYDIPVDVYFDKTGKSGFVKLTEKTRKVDEHKLATMLSRPAFESLPVIHKPIGEYTSKKKEAIWDIAGEIDTTKGIRRSTIYAEIHVVDPKTKQKVVIEKQMPAIRGNQSARGMIFNVLNKAIEGEGMMLYDRTKDKIFASRYGLTKAKIEKIIITKARK